MSDFTEELRRVPLLLKGVGIFGSSDDLNVVRDQFPFLSFALRSHQCAAHGK